MSDKKDWWDKLNIVSTVAIAGMVGYWGYAIDRSQQSIQLEFNKATMDLQKQQQAAQAKYNEAVIKLDSERAEVDKKQKELDSHINSLRLSMEKLKIEADTRNKDEDQLTQRLAVVTTLMPHISKDENSRKVAIIALSKLGSEDMAMEFASIYQDTEAKEAGDEIQNHGISREQGKIPTPIFNNLSFDPNNVKTGWMYLGRKDGVKWSGNYTVLDDRDSVTSLNGKVVTVKEGVSGVNIRTGYPSMLGKLKPTIHTLKPGSEVRIGSKHHYTFNDFIWVSVDYSPPQS
ncbi:hypothetical protein [Photobacterium kasasachensis]|uniref:hypothetical protein n=1 Tax=Photobacterium kasasachensis TaxID=2910240 RepID=UPI003D0FBF31